MLRCEMCSGVPRSGEGKRGADNHACRTSEPHTPAVYFIFYSRERSISASDSDLTGKSEVQQGTNGTRRETVPSTTGREAPLHRSLFRSQEILGQIGPYARWFDEHFGQQRLHSYRNTTTNVACQGACVWLSSPCFLLSETSSSGCLQIS